MDLSVRLALTSEDPALHEKVEATILELLGPCCADPVCHERVQARELLCATE